LGEGVGDSSATSCSTIEAQKDAGCRKEMRERRAFISLSLDPCQKNGRKVNTYLDRQAVSLKIDTMVSTHWYPNIFTNKAFYQQAGVQFSVFESEPSNAHYRPREWSMGIHWSLPQLESLLPPDLKGRLKEAQNDPFLDAPDQDVMKVYNGLDGSLLKALPLPRTIRVSRRKLRTLCSQGIDVKVCENQEMLGRC
jgi:hypothetical protein